MTCSIDGASSATYKIYRKGGDFETVMANIRKINEFKAKYQSAFAQDCAGNSSYLGIMSMKIAHGPGENGAQTGHGYFM